MYSRSKQVSYTCIYNLKQNIVQDKKTFILHLYIKTEVIGQQWRLQRSEIMFFMSSVNIRPLNKHITSKWGPLK